MFSLTSFVLNALAKQYPRAVKIAATARKRNIGIYGKLANHFL
jgi:hypothetical protein